MTNKLEDYGKSLQLADVINRMKPLLMEIDLEHAMETAKQMSRHGDWQDSAAVLNPSYDPDKSDLLRVQGKALSTLVEYAKLLKRCDELKETVAANSAARSEIDKMFL
jgi:hypothetical protein